MTCTAAADEKQLDSVLHDAKKAEKALVRSSKANAFPSFLYTFFAVRGPTADIATLTSSGAGVEARHEGEGARDRGPKGPNTARAKLTSTKEKERNA